MISAARTTSKISSRGFSLMEIIMVLAIASMVMAGAIGVLVFNSSERHLKRASTDLEVLAKNARMTAMLQQRPYELEFLPGVVRLQPFGTIAGEDRPAPKKAGSARSSHSVLSRAAREEQEDADAQPAIEPLYKELSIDPDLEVSLRRFGSDKWQPMDARRSQIWRFDTDGTCEPIGVRIANNQNSWIENTFHPLTASVSDTSAEFR